MNMANRLKSPAKKGPDPEKLVAEKEEKVELQEVVKDERTWKIVGVILLMLCFFFFIAFTSYLFTWKEDQDKVFQYGISILAPNDLAIENLLGSFGAYVSHLFFFKGFGIASYLFCSFLFVVGVNLLFDRKIFSVSRNIKYLISGLIVISLTAAYALRFSNFPWGGEVGNLLSHWSRGVLGELGTIVLILVAFLTYIIWRFNPSFTIPSFNKKRNLYNGEEHLEMNDVAIKGTQDSTQGISPDQEKESSAQTSRGNSLKNGKVGSTASMQEVEAETEEEIEMDLIEKDDVDEDAEEEYEEEYDEEDVTDDDDTSELSEDDTLDSSGKVQGRKIQQVPVSPLKLEIKPIESVLEEVKTPEKVAAMEPYDPILDLRDYKYPELDLLEQQGGEKIEMNAAELEANKNQIINTLKNYDIAIQKILATVGPTVTLYEIIPAAGVRISRIKNLEDDIALSLSALGIRIIAPIPGKGTIGIEVPNVKKSVVGIRSLLSSEKFRKNNFALPIAIGKKIDNDLFIVDLATMPHLLMAGATGQGKSVGVNAILVSLLYKKHPSQLKFVLVDPKKVELSLYRLIEKHFLAKLPGEEEAIITDTKKVVYTLNALCIEMDTRYDLLKEAHCRNIREYNEKFAARKLNPEKGHQFLPFIVLVIDEFADLIMTAGKEIEMPIARLAQLARAVGIHLIIATQRPSVNIITGTIKANFPARIAFKVSSKVDSRTILDTGGAEQLIGRGDMLVSYNGELTRLQCVFVDTPEVERVVEFIGKQRGYPHAFMLPEYSDKDADGKEFDAQDRDPLFEDAARLIVQSQVGSTSLLQRRMKLGYNRAGRLMDQLESAGIVGSNQGSKAREVLVKSEFELEQLLESFQ